MAPWCAVGDVPTCAKLNYYGGAGSCARWHSDDEVLFGRRGESKLIVSVSIGFSALSGGNLGPVRTVKQTLLGYTTVTSWSWMGVVKMSTFTVRTPG